MDLNQLSIASPCTMDWDAMTGDDCKRFCNACQLNVYNISNMSRKEAETLIKETEGRLCIRMYRRADGTVITQDCPVGLKRIHGRRKKLKLAGIAATILFVTIAGTLTALAAEPGLTPCPPKNPPTAPQEPLMGAVPNPNNRPTMGEAVAPNVSPQPQQEQGEMGDVAIPQHPSPKNEPPPAPIMGKPVTPYANPPVKPPQR